MITKENLLKYGRKNFGHILPLDTTYSFQKWSSIIHEVYLMYEEPNKQDQKILALCELLKKTKGSIYKDLFGKTKFINRTKKSTY